MPSVFCANLGYMSNAIIRSATRDDLPGMLGLYRHLHPDDPQPDVPTPPRSNQVSRLRSLGSSKSELGKSAFDFPKSQATPAMTAGLPALSLAAAAA
jgi:hypothetical protein